MENKKSKKIIIGVICAVVAVALVVAILAITGVFSKEPNEDPSNSTTESTTKAPKYDPTKYEVQGIDDKSYLVVLGEDGKAVINDKNQINVVERDKNGEIIKDEKGEPQTHWEQIDDKYVVKDTIYATDYTINVIDGWEAFGSGYIRKLDASVGGTFMKCSALPDTSDKVLTLDEYLKQLNEKRQKKYEAQKKNGFTIDYSEKEITITDKKIKAVYYTEMVKNKNGGIVNYSETIYFELANNKKYSFQLTLSDDANYNANKDFDFVDYVNKNLIVK